MQGIKAIDRYGRPHKEQTMSIRHRPDWIYVPLEKTPRLIYPWEFIKGVAALGSLLGAIIWLFQSL